MVGFQNPKSLKGNDKMTNKYSDCWYCGGEVIEQLVGRDYHWKKRLYIFENVPMGVCKQCGEKFIKSNIAKKMEAIVLKNVEPTKKLEVPVYTF